MPCIYTSTGKVLVGVLLRQTLKDTSRRDLGSQEALTQTVTAPGSSDQGVTSGKSNKASLHVVCVRHSTATPSGRCCVYLWGKLVLVRRTCQGSEIKKETSPSDSGAHTRSQYQVASGCSLSRRSSTLVWNWRPWHSSWSVKGRGQGEVGLGCSSIERGRNGGTLRLGLAQKGR